ncbi:hypothetical protein Q9966_015655 [Columba livia]|nr:hypothetical protein Q9966_015655 [Columba livia]
MACLADCQFSEYKISVMLSLVCVAHWLRNQISFKMAEFKVTIFPGLAGMLEFCRQNKNCNDVAEDHELSQNHMLGGFGKP